MVNPTLNLTHGEERASTPRRPAAAAVHPQPHVQVPRLDGVHVLVVDDEPDALRLMKRLLESRGAQVTTTPGAQEAMAAISEDAPDVILSDIAMPGEDGYALMRRIRGLPGALAEIPAAAVTAFARPDDRARALLCGFQLHLAKPIDPLELLAAVANLAGRV